MSGYTNLPSCSKCGESLYGLDAVRNEQGELVCVICVPVSCPLKYAAPREPVVGEEIALGRHSQHGLRFVRWEETKAGRKMLLHSDYAPEKNFICIANEYITLWRFADDEGVKWISDLEIQLAAYRRAYQGRLLDDSIIPPCSNCGAWPCESRDGCIDFHEMALGKPRPKKMREWMRKAVAA